MPRIRQSPTTIDLQTRFPWLKGEGVKDVNEQIDFALLSWDLHALNVKPGGPIPGARISGIENVPNGRRVRYQNGAIYESRGGVMAWVTGAIAARYEQIGGPSSWLGLPIKDEEAMSEEGGRASVFEHGTVYWWPDVGAIDLNQVSVHYTGIKCFGETDDDRGSDSDEPYVIVGVVTPTGGHTLRSQIYGDVDGGEMRFDPIEVFRGTPAGITLGITLMEWDDGDPDKYRAEVQKGVDAAMKKAVPVIAKALNGVPYVGPALALAATAVLPELEPFITEILNRVLGTGDDTLGSAVITLTAKQMVVLSARTGPANHDGLIAKVETPLLEAQGASYKVYFNLVTA